MELLGHVIGLIGTAVFFISYQCFNKKKLLILQTLGTALMGVQYLLIGGYAGFTLNMVGIVRNLLYYHRDKKPLSGLWLPIVTSAVMTAVGFLSWEGYHSLLIIAGLAINAFCLGVCDSQNLRKSVLVTCPMVLLYSVFEGSYGGMLNESITLISAVVGIVRYCKEKGKNDANQ